MLPDVSSLKLRQQFPFFSDAQETDFMSCMLLVMKAKDMPLGAVLLSLDGFWYGSNVHVIHLDTDSRSWG
jgi:hypothetical protein